MWTYGQPLGVVLLVRSEQGIDGVVARDNETGKVGQELTTEVEDDEEEVEGGDADDGVRLGDVGLLLEVVQGGVLGQLPHTPKSALMEHQFADAVEILPRGRADRCSSGHDPELTYLRFTGLT